MKKIILLLFFIPLCIQCNQNRLSQKQVVEIYFNARNAKDFNQIENVINDSITIVEGDYVIRYSKESFYEIFRWDSIFQTSYKIVDLDIMSNQIVASIRMNSIRHDFLQNSQMNCAFQISFIADKISKIEILDCKNVDWNIWQKCVNTLVKWTAKNHPELDGFIHDMTMEGAKKYMKAIKLYNDSYGQNKMSF